MELVGWGVMGGWLFYGGEAEECGRAELCVLLLPSSLFPSSCSIRLALSHVYGLRESEYGFTKRSG